MHHSSSCCSYKRKYFIFVEGRVLVDFFYDSTAAKNGKYTLPVEFFSKSHVHTEKYFRNLVNPNQIWIVITILQQIQHQTEFRLAPNLSEKGNYNRNLVWITNILKRFLCVYHIVELQPESKLFLKNIFQKNGSDKLRILLGS